MANGMDEEIEEQVAEMSAYELQEYNEQIVAEVREFIDRNTDRNSNQVRRIREDRDFAAGDQWNDADRTNRTEGRLELAIPIAQNFVSAVVNPICAKPFKIKYDVVPKYADVFGEKVKLLNAIVDKIQDGFEFKDANRNAVEDEVTTGLGFGYVTTEDRDGDVVVKYHAIEDSTMVIWDADAHGITMDDAKQAVVIELIGEDEAKERFGSDVFGGHYASKSTLGHIGNDFAIPEGKVPLLTYFRVEGHNCEFHRLIGEAVVDSDLIEGLTRIPIISFKGEKTWFNKEIGWTGIIHRLKPMQRLANYANSQMLERLAMSPKMSFVGVDTAIEDYEELWQNANYATAAYLPYHSRDKEGNAIEKPDFVQMGAKVDDLQAVINGSIQQMQFATGVSPSGIVDQTIKDDVTATEVLLRTKSSQSNVSHYLEHTRESYRAVGQVLAEMCIYAYGLEIPNGVFEVNVDGGSVDLTKKEEDRRSLLAMMQFAPDNFKGVLAFGLMQTMDVDESNAMSQMLFKLLPPDVQQAAIGDTTVNQKLAMAMKQVQALQQQNAQLQQNLQQLQMEAQQLQLRTKSDVAIKQLDNQNKLQLKQMDILAKQQESNAELAAKSQMQVQQIVADANAAQAKAAADVNKAVAEIQAKVNAEADAETRKMQAQIAAQAIGNGGIV